MQRRAATVYAVLFLVVAAGAYSLIGTAQQPTIDVDGQTYAQNETVTVNGRTYNVSSVGEGQGTLEWTNQSAAFTATWANNSTVQFQNNNTYRVFIPNTSNPNQFTLRQEFNLSDNTTTVKQGNQTFVVVNQSGGNKSLVPVDQYKRQQFGQPDTRRYSEGQTFQFNGNRTTVRNVTTESATLAWNAPKTNQVSLSEGGAVDLGPPTDNRTFVAHFPGNGNVVLSPNVDGYQQQVQDINHFNERIAGLWGVVILSFLTVVLLVGLAFLPNK
ncbi:MULTISPECIES: hypothetical protein [Halorussus]|uniref:hypothetical protein n=1 Tax=Halorussus TaxID=1070314 RepID=UPI0020A014BF|nr:hypothetical protein [Halorussus vallis]USZ74182.1 hypothetical protein NGM07_12080 [Halorussus vallis]